MECPAERVRPTSAGRWRFSLRGMFLMTFIAALAAAEGRAEKKYSAALFAFVSALAAAGLLAQGLDLRRTARSLPDLSRNEQWSVRFSVGWRVSVAALLAGWYLLRVLVRGGALSLPDSGYNAFFNVGDELRAALLYLLLVIAAQHSLPPAERRLRAGGRILVNLMGAIAVALLAIVFWWNQVMVVFLVQLACIGIAETGPPRLVGQQSVLQTGIPNFLWMSEVGTFVSAVLLFLVWQFVSRPSSVRRRWTLGALLVAGFASGFAIVAWIAGPGLRGASPWMAEAFVIAPANLWLTAFIVIAILAAVAAIRWRAFEPDSDGQTRFVTVRDGQAYCHEGLGWPLVLAVAAGSRAWEILSFWNPFSRDWLGIVFSRDWIAALWSMAGIAVEDCECVLAVLVCFVALRRVWRALRRRSLTAPIEIVEFDPRRFATAWLLLFLLAVIALPTLAALSVALYFTRWYNLPPLDWY
jgi:hypothetical protein